MRARWRRAVCAGALAAALSPCARAVAAQPGSFLDSIHRQTTLTSTVPENGDQNPYAIVVAPVSAGVIQKDDVLITNFNNDGNLQGLGTTIVAFNPTTKKLTTFASLPRNLAGCPGGIGLTTAMTMLKSGWVIVGSAPSADGTTANQGARLPDRARRQRQGRERHRQRRDQYALGQHGDDRQWRQRHDLRQQRRFRRRLSGRRPAGRERADGRAPQACDQERRAAVGGRARPSSAAASARSRTRTSS